MNQTMDKVKLPKEVAEAIEHLRDTGKAESYHDFIHYDRGPHFEEPAWDKIVKYRETHFSNFVEALVIGWELEETPEDKVRRQYQHLIHCGSGDSIEDRQIKIAEIEGMLFVLKTYGHEVKGVNADADSDIT